MTTTPPEDSIEVTVVADPTVARATVPLVVLAARVARATLARNAGYLLELVAFALIAALVATVAAPIWALIPIAAYLLLISAAIGLRRGRQGGR